MHWFRRYKRLKNLENLRGAHFEKSIKNTFLMAGLLGAFFLWLVELNGLQKCCKRFACNFVRVLRSVIYSVNWLDYSWREQSYRYGMRVLSVRGNIPWEENKNITSVRSGCIRAVYEGILAKWVCYFYVCGGDQGYIQVGNNIAVCYSFSVVVTRRNQVNPKRTQPVINAAWTKRFRLTSVKPGRRLCIWFCSYFPMIMT